MVYPTLDGRIASTYAERSTAKSTRVLYDSYLRAFRWATDRVGNHGVVAFVSNGGWIDGNTADGIRLSLADEYSRIYVYNLRGNQRTAGELSRREGGKVFGSGSRNTVAIIIGVKNPARTERCEILYRDIGDYLSREQKLESIASGTIETVEWQAITPNEHGDWISQRNAAFMEWPVIGDKAAGVRVFARHSLGLGTNRDSWVYNYSRRAIALHVVRMITVYSAQVAEFAKHCELNRIIDRKSEIDKFIDTDPRKISWGGTLKLDAAAGKQITFKPNAITVSAYRPFQNQNVYFDRDLNHRVFQLPSMFPTPHHENVGMQLNVGGTTAPFCGLMVRHIPDLNFFGQGGQFFPRWTYQKVHPEDHSLALDTGDVGEPDEYGYRRVDNITDEILKRYQAAVGGRVTKDDIFFYTYGLLHEPAYRETYAADLKKMLPHIPTPETQERFEQLASAGRALADFHVGYEDVVKYPVNVQLKPGADPTDRETWRVSKLRWAKKKDPGTGKSVDDVTKLIYNTKVTITGIPEEAERYMLGSRSALAWIIDRYQVKTDKASGIVNDPNDWCDEHDDPRYIVDLIAKVATVAVETMKIVDGLAESG